MAEKEYRKLARSQARPEWVAISTRCSLWLGRDHILNLETNGYSETYRRFYFRDIHSITIRQTQRWLYVTVALACVAAVGLALAAGISEPVTRYIFAGVGGAFGLAAVLNAIPGPSCVCHVRTAVQSESLPALNRVRKAQRVIDRVLPLIEEAQGRLTPDEVQALATPPAPAQTQPVPESGALAPGPEAKEGEGA